MSKDVNLNMKDIELYKVVFSVPPDVRDIIENEIGWQNIDGYLISMLRNESRINESRSKNDNTRRT